MVTHTTLSRIPLERQSKLEMGIEFKEIEFPPRKYLALAV